MHHPLTKCIASSAKWGVRTKKGFLTFCGLSNPKIASLVKIVWEWSFSHSFDAHKFSSYPALNEIIN